MSPFIVNDSLYDLPGLEKFPEIAASRNRRE
jgi:hypothetical protein